MDIRVTSIDKIFYRIDSQLGALLCAAFPTVFEQVQAAAPPPPVQRGNGITEPVFYNEPAWGVELRGDRPVVVFKYRAETLFFNGSPEELVSANFRGFAAPAQIVQRYRAAHSSGLDDLSLAQQEIQRDHDLARLRKQAAGSG